MDTNPDSELLRRYVTEGSEHAFEELVQRHLDTIYAFAWRKVDGDPASLFRATVLSGSGEASRFERKCGTDACRQGG